MDPYRLGLTVAHGDGTETRLAFDEPDPRDVIQDGHFTTVAPGGFGTFEGHLNRDVARDGLGKLSRFDTFRLWGPGNDTAFEGYGIGLPAQKGEAAQIQTDGTGWSAHLTDDESLAVIFVTRDLSLWQPPTLNLRLATFAATFPLDTDFVATVKEGSLGFQSHTQKAIDLGSQADLMATAPGSTKLAVFQYLGTEAGVAAIETPQLLSTDDDAAANGMDGWASSVLTLDGTLRTVSLATARKFLGLRMRKITNTTALVNPARRQYTLIGLRGDHGLPSYSIPGEPDGLLASDVIAYMLDQVAPLLTYRKSPAPDPTIVDSSEFVIPELQFANGATAQEVIEAANAYHLWDWFVWEGRTFYYVPADSIGKVWRARTDRGARLQLAGPQAADQWSGVAVYYTTPQGETRSVGPPSVSSRFSTSDSALEITDPALSEVVAHNRTRIKRLDLEFPTTLAGAIQIGAVWLAEQQKIQSQGSVVIGGDVVDQNGVVQPCWKVRAGDRIIVEDVSSEARRIVDTDYTFEDRSVTANLDSPPQRFEAMLAQLNARTKRVGVTS